MSSSGSFRRSGDEEQSDTLKSALYRIYGGADKAPKSRVLYLATAIDDTTSTALQIAMRELWPDEEEITLVVNSTGGYTLDGLAIYDLISESNKTGNPVHAVVNGCAMSAAAVLLQAAKVRTITKNSYLMIHQGWGTIEGTVTQVAAIAQWWRELEDRCNTLTAKRAHLTKKALDERIGSGDWYLNAKEALNYGFVDRVA